MNKHTTQVTIVDKHTTDRESHLKIHLAQGIAKGSKMDFTIQKAVELGVTEITPLFTERCDVKLSMERQDKKNHHWQDIILAACRQCGRNTLPRLHVPTTLDRFLTTHANATGIVLSPQATHSMRALSPTTSILLLVGPEGGLSDGELEKAQHQGFMPIKLGPRILRTETAGLAAISALQTQLGDFG